jgi:hypothetical protein
LHVLPSTSHPPSASDVYAVTGRDPKTLTFHGQTCHSSKEADASAKEYRRQGYENVAVVRVAAALNKPVG